MQRHSMAGRKPVSLVYCQRHTAPPFKALTITLANSITLFSNRRTNRQTVREPGVEKQILRKVTEV